MFFLVEFTLIYIQFLNLFLIINCIFRKVDIIIYYN